MENIYLSVIIPAYNEEARLPGTLEKTISYLKSQSYGWEIVVVNDGSKDRTADVVKEFISQNKNVRLIDNKENHGKGYVVRQGLLMAKGDYRIFMDSDNSTSVDEVEKMFPLFENGYGIVIGSRDIKGSNIVVSQGWLRKMFGNAFNLLTQFICGLWGIWDTQCGFKGLTKECVEKVIPRCKIDRFAFDPEILVVGKKMGCKIKEIPVTWVNDTDSRVKVKNIINMAIDLFKIRLNIINGSYEKK